MIPRKSTLLNMPFEKIRKYETFFNAYHKHLLTTPYRDEIKELIKNERRDSEQSILKDFEDGYCPRKWQASRYVPAKIIILNINTYISEYEKVVKKMKYIS